MRLQRSREGSDSELQVAFLEPRLEIKLSLVELVLDAGNKNRNALRGNLHANDFTAWCHPVCVVLYLLTGRHDLLCSDFATVMLDVVHAVY